MGEGDVEDGDDVYRGSVEPVLDSLSNLYSNEDRIFSVGSSRSSSYPTYTIY